MKSVLVLFTILFGLSSMAATQIPNDKFQTYIKAVRLSLAQKPLKCDNFATGLVWSSGELAAALSQALSGTVDTNGQQPLLVFANDKGPNDHFWFYITTSADLKTVEKINFLQQSCTDSDVEVNLGDLSNPQIVTQTKHDCKTTYSTECK